VPVTLRVVVRETARRLRCRPICALMAHTNWRSPWASRPFSFRSHQLFIRSAVIVSFRPTMRLI